MKQLQLKDFLNYKFLSAVTASEDGKLCVFVVNECDEENNNYKSNLYLYKDGTIKALTSSNKDSNPVLLDNQTVLFKSGRDAKPGEEVTNFYTISLEGGEAQKAFDLPLYAGKIVQLNEKEYVLTAAYDKDYSVQGREDQKEALLKAKKDNADYEVFTKIPFCHNGRGYAKNTVQRLYLYNTDTKELTALTDLNTNVASFQLNENKSEMLVTHHQDRVKPSRNMAVSTYDFNTKQWNSLVNEDVMNLQSAWYFNDGVLLMGNKEITHGLNENGRFYFLKDNEMTLLYDNVMSTHNSVGSDCRYGGGAGSKVVNDKFYYTTTKDKDGIIVSIDKDGNYQEELILDGSVDCFDIQNGKIYYIAMKDGALQELYCDNQKLTDFNTAVLADTYVADYQEIPFENDGIAFTGWVLQPKDYDPNKKYPAILDIHGGPKTAYGKVFYHEMQLWANMGYFVFFTNPRGSDGRDNDFMNIFGQYGTIDYDDLMKFTDVVLETYPAIDQSRVGVTGGSYGGFMTNWIIGHTDRFACAATQRSISNWISFYGTSDIGMFFAGDQIHGNIFNKPEKLWEHSPLKYADNIVTPTLFIHSDEDYRCPLEQGLQLYTAIIDKGIDTRFVLFHGENHELSRGGKPKHRIRRLEEITAWMEKYLK